MEEMKLIIAIGVPYHVEIAATGIPLHEAKVDFCIPKQNVSFNFPAKAITDNEYVFTVTDAVKEYLNTTVEYKLYVYYGNARFEADTGSFNLVDKTAFDVAMKQPEKKKLGEALHEKVKSRSASNSNKKVEAPKKPTVNEVVTKVVEPVVEPVVTEPVIESKKVVEPVVTETPVEVTPEDKPKATVNVRATKPTPTPTIEPTTTLKEAKEAMKKVGSARGLAGMLPTQTAAPTKDANTKVKDILESINKTVTPSTELATTPTDGNEPTSGNFLEEVEKMREAQALIQKERKSKEKSQRVKDAIKKAEESSTKKK